MVYKNDSRSHFANRVTNHFVYQLLIINCHVDPRAAIIDSSCTSGTSTLETYYSNCISMLLYAQKCLRYRKIQYWPEGIVFNNQCD